MIYAGLTTYAAQAALAALIPNAGANRYVALFWVLPGMNGVGGTEITDANYMRVPINLWTESHPGTLNGGFANTNDVSFPAFAGDVAGVVGWGLYDSAVGGNLLAVGWLMDGSFSPITRNFLAGDVARFPAGNLVLGVFPSEHA